MSTESARIVTTALRGVVEYGTAMGAAIARPVAAKTGTSNDYADAWLVGYSPQLVAATWVGHPAGSVPMRDVNGVSRVTGGSIPASIWRDVMSAAHNGLEVADFQPAPDRPPATTIITQPPPPPPVSTTSSPAPAPTATAPAPTTARPVRPVPTTGQPPRTNTTQLSPSTTTTTQPVATTTTQPAPTTQPVPTTTTTQPAPSTTTTQPAPTTTTTQPAPTTTTTQPGRTEPPPLASSAAQARTSR